jgi:hypothetical protein
MMCYYKFFWKSSSRFQKPFYNFRFPDDLCKIFVETLETPRFIRNFPRFNSERKNIDENVLVWQDDLLTTDSLPTEL